MSATITPELRQTLRRLKLSPTRAEARTSIFAWVARYNRRRLHSTLSYLPPTE